MVSQNITFTTNSKNNNESNNEILSAYNQLQQQLVKLNYNETFTPESIPLIKRILNDLFTITENHQALQTKTQKIEKEKWESHCQVEPLKRSVASLTKENNQLHTDLIHEVDVHNKERTKNKLLIRKHEKENMDLKFLNSQFIIQTQQAEKKLENERKKIDELLKIYSRDASGNSGGLSGKGSRTNNVLEPHLDMEEPLVPMPDKFVFTPPDPHIANIVQQCQKKIKELEQSNEKLSDKEKNLQEQVLSLQQQIVSREKEIARLGSLLINKRSEKIDDSSTFNAKVQQLETQLEYLQEYVIGLEQDIAKLGEEKESITKESEEEKKEILEELQNARERNHTLFSELQKLEELVNELSETKKKGKQDDNKEETLASTLSSSNKEELDEHETTSAESKADLENISSENVQLKIALDKANNEIEVLKKDLQSTTDRLRDLYTFAKEGSSSTKPLKKTEQKISNVPPQESLNNKNAKNVSSVEDTENKYAKELASIEQENNDLEKCLEQCQKELEEVKTQLNNANEQITNITSERNNLKELYKQLNQQLQTQRRSPTPQNHRKEIDQLNLQLNGAREEIEIPPSIQQTLEKLPNTENGMADLREDFELQQPSRVNSYESNYETLEVEVKEARKVVQKMEQELSSIRDRFQQVNQKLIEREEAFESLKKESEEVTIERDKLLAELQNIQYTSAFDDITNITRGNKMLGSQLVEVTKHRNQLLAELEDKENHVKYLNDLIVTKDQEKDALMDSYRKLLDEQQTLDSTVRNSSQESNNLKMEMLLRDRRAQQLQKTLEDCSLDIKQYKAELSNYERQCDTLTRTLENAQRDLAQSESERANLLREVSTSRALSSTLDNAKSQLQKRITVLTIENERLQSTVKSLQIEKDLVLHQLKSEKARADRLEKVISQVRKNQVQNPSKQRDILSKEIDLKDDQLGLTDNRVVNIVIEKLGEVQDDLKRKVELLEVQLQEKRTGVSYNNNNNANFDFGTSTSDGLITFSKGNPNLNKSKPLDFTFSSRQMFDNFHDDKIPSFPLFDQVTSSKDKSSKVNTKSGSRSSTSSSLKSSNSTKTETHDPRIREVQLLNDDNERLMNAIIQTKEDLQREEFLKRIDGI